MLDDPVLGRIAVAHGVSTAQVILRWHVQRGTVLIPKSVTPSRIAANIDLFTFALGADEMAAIAGLDRGERIGPDPETFC